MKAIHYKGQNKFYLFDKPGEPRIVPDTMEYLMQENKHVKMYVGGDVFGNDKRKAKYEKELTANLSAGKEIINPEGVANHEWRTWNKYNMGWRS
jgi:hypothetical protein